VNNAEILTASVSQLLDAYRLAAVTYGDAVANGRHRAANRSHDLLTNIRKELASRGEESAAALAVLLQDAEPAVRLWAATHCLDIQPVAAIQALEELVAQPASPLGLMAGIALADSRKKRNF